jgi:hypothetical protein
MQLLEAVHFPMLPGFDSIERLHAAPYGSEKSIRKEEHWRGERPSAFDPHGPAISRFEGDVVDLDALRHPGSSSEQGTHSRAGA